MQCKIKGEKESNGSSIKQMYIYIYTYIDIGYLQTMQSKYVSLKKLVKRFVLEAAAVRSPVLKGVSHGV